MPTNDELRAARERLRNNGYEYTVDMGSAGWRSDFREEDLEVVAAAHLDEHPPDEDEPVTAEWLESQGWELYRDCKPVGYEFVLPLGHPAKPLNWYATGCVFAGRRAILKNPTRRQLNHLIAAFKGE